MSSVGEMNRMAVRVDKLSRFVQKLLVAAALNLGRQRGLNDIREQLDDCAGSHHAVY